MIARMSRRHITRYWDRVFVDSTSPRRIVGVQLTGSALRALRRDV